MTKQNNHSCEVYHFDLYGTREEKYRYLQTHNLNDVEWQQLNPQAPSFFFVPKDFSLQQEYEQGFKIDELMRVNISGIQSGRDDLYIDNNKQTLKQRIFRLLNNDIDKNFVEQYNIKDSSSYPLLKRIADSKFNENNIVKAFYRPFDNKYIYYDPKLIKRAFYNVMRHLLYGYYRDTERMRTTNSPQGMENISLIVCRQQSTFDFQHVFCSTLISDMNSISLQSREGSYVFPLYLYPEEGSIETERRVNMDEAIVAKIMQCAAKGTHSSPSAAQINPTAPEDGCVPSHAESEKVNADETSALQVFDYIYGVLHSPSYRTQYKEFLKVDFPRIPYPKDQAEFEHFRSYGQQLRLLHLMDNATMQQLSEKYQDIATFPESGNMMVEQVTFDAGEDDRVPRVRINATQYFAGVPKEAWDFYIGGYRPAQKWLKDRTGRQLTFDDIAHYRRIIAVLTETDKQMKTIDLH